MSRLRWPTVKGILGLGRRGAPGPRTIILGLGNPGPEYARTRHNVGFWCIDLLARRHSIGLARGNRHALVGEGTIAGVNVVLAKPRTFVNESGRAAAYLLARYRASAADLVVIHDDMDLAVGRLRVRPRGGGGGHKGIKSIIEHVGTQEFARVRVGIGRPQERADDVDHVLGAMSPAERDAVEEALGRAADAVAGVLTEGVEAAMNRFN